MDMRMMGRYPVVFGIVVLGGIFCVALYLFQAVGLSQMSKRRGFHWSWMAFIPIASGYVLGGIADNINLCYGKKTSWRIWVSVFQAAGLAGGIVMLVQGVREFPHFLDFFFFMKGRRHGNIGNLLHLAMPMLAIVLIAALIAVACTALSSMALYQVYKDYSSSAVILTVFSILFGIAPFFLFALRMKPSTSLAHRHPFSSPAATGCQPPQNQSFKNFQGPAV